MDKKTSKKSKKSRMAVNSTASQKAYKQLKNQNLKQEKKDSRNHVIKTIFMLVLFLVAIVLVCMSGAFSVSEIIVEGNDAISKEQMISFSGIEKGTNLFAISKENVVSKMKENPYIDSVEIRRCLPNKIKLVVKERKIEYALPLANSYIYVNREGYVLRISNELSQVPQIIGFSTDLTNLKENQQLEQVDLDKMRCVEKIMQTAIHYKIQDLISKIDISNEKDYAIYFETEGKIAYLGEGMELNTRFLYIKAILKEQQGKTGKIFANVDLNAEWVYFSEESI